MTQRATPQQTQFFYTTLKALVSGSFLPLDHPLLRVPIDPDMLGIRKSERQAVKKLQEKAGNWSYKLRQAWYSYHEAGKRTQAINRCVTYMTMYDAEMRQLLSSHSDDPLYFPYVFFLMKSVKPSFGRMLERWIRKVGRHDR